jgi:hypothetical protein
LLDAAALEVPRVQRLLGDGQDLAGIVGDDGFGAGGALVDGEDVQDGSWPGSVRIARGSVINCTT